MNGYGTYISYKPYFDQQREIDDGASDDLFPEQKPFTTLCTVVEAGPFENGWDSVFLADDTITDRMTMQNELDALMSAAGHSLIWNDPDHDECAFEQAMEDEI